MAAVEVRNLFQGSHAGHPAEGKKDKLAETKRQEKLIKEALKEEREKAKEKRVAETKEEHEAYRLERSWNPVQSKRAAREARQAAKHEAKAAEGQTCEHGIWKCRICFPNHHGK